MSENRKLAAILAADVVGFSRLAATDEERTVARLRGLRTDLIDPAISVHHGRVVKRTGDGILIEFRSVVDAVRCAIEVQNGMVERNAGLPPERQILFRAGVHLGDVIEEADGDLMGDGVNIAARLESICEPGAICLSEQAYWQVKSRLDLAVADLGDKDLKNIPEPVHVYSLEVGKPAQAKPVVTVAPIVVPPAPKKRSMLVPLLAGIAALLIIVAAGAWYFLARPGANLAANTATHLSIVVLPFANLSNDPKQDYFADGITENLTTDLSRIRNSFVIARNTAFTYKGKNIDAKEIGKELDVRYVLEGSVQRDGNRVRVNAQLIDAESGAHLWAERFEEDLADLFKLQDDVVARLARTLQVELVNAEAARSLHERPQNPDAIDLTMQGWAAVNRSSTRDSYSTAQRLFEAALKIDPANAGALSGMAEIHRADFAYGWTSPQGDSFAKAMDEADRASTLDPALANPYYVKSTLLFYKMKVNDTVLGDQALSAANMALRADPSFAPAEYAIAATLELLGRYEEAKQHLAQAIKVSPRDPAVGRWYMQMGREEFGLRYFEQAAEWEHRAIDAGYRTITPYVTLAAADAELGRVEAAHDAMADARRLNPSLSVAWFQTHIASFLYSPAGFLDAARKAGLPEDSPPPPPKHLSIVVLPFQNLSGDPKQDYFADGITENLTTDLSRIRNSFVIARNTAFTYKGKNVDAKEIGKELDVRYVLEGSVQRDGNRVRVNAQLIDAESGAHLWADRFEEDLADLFKLQDDVVARLANSLGNELIKVEAERSTHAKTPDAIDLVMRGRALLQEQRTKENTIAARAWFEQALKIDPNDADALAGDAQTYYFEYSYGWTNSKTNYDAKILAQADRAIALNPNALWAYVAKSSYLFLSDRPNESLSAADAGLAINPNFAPLYSAHHGAEVSLGRFEQAKSDVQQSMRLSPRDPEIGYWHMQLGSIELSLMHFDAAIEEEQKAINAGFRTFVPYSHLAADYALEGKTEEAKSALTEARRLNPSLTVKWRLARGPNLPILIEGLRKAGLPEDEGPRLSIVVLPFQNLSGDAKQDYLADVLTDELTTYISRIPGSFVIARNTAFTYKGRPTDVKTIGKDLGVRYALEGSVQPTDKRIRTNAQLIDTETGAHLWAEEFDNDKTDLLETQDEIVTRLARTLQLQLTEIEAARLTQTHPANSEAQELALRCDAMVSGSGSLYGGKDAEAGYALCEKALEVDPKNVVALAFLSIKFGSRVQEYMSVDRDADLARSEEFATRALAIDPNNAYAFVGRAFALIAQGRFEEARITAEHALALAPSLIEAYNLQTLIDLYTGNAEKVIESADKAMRLSPRDPLLFNFIALKGTAYFMRREDAKAIELFRRANALSPSPTPNYFYLAAAQALSGHVAEARETLKRYLAIPSVRTRSIAAWKTRTYSTNPAYLAMRERVYDGLRKAGMPEQ